FLFMLQLPRRSTLFPYTTLFRSLINEPTAAALMYALKTQQSATVMVVDVGCETCEVSLAEIGGGVCEVRASVGDLRLGGDDFDQDRKSTRLNSSHVSISYAVFCL